MHGIPSAEPLRDGDLVSVDTGALLDGWAGDSAISFTVGEARPEDTRLIATANEALAAGIGAAVAGNRIGDIAHAIGTVCRDAGYGILEGYGGHGIGRSMHEDPSVPNEGRPGRGMVLRHGMVLAIEPMLLAGGLDEFRHDPDGWTLRTTDGSQGRARRAHGGDHERRPSRADRALSTPYGDRVRARATSVRRTPGQGRPRLCARARGSRSGRSGSP